MDTCNTTLLSQISRQILYYWIVKNSDSVNVTNIIVLIKYLILISSTLCHIYELVTLCVIYEEIIIIILMSESSTEKWSSCTKRRKESSHSENSQTLTYIYRNSDNIFKFFFIYGQSFQFCVNTKLSLVLIIFHVDAFFIFWP